MRALLKEEKALDVARESFRPFDFRLLWETTTTFPTSSPLFSSLLPLSSSFQVSVSQQQLLWPPYFNRDAKGAAAAITITNRFSFKKG